MESEKINVRIRRANADELEKVNAFYKSCGYYASANSEDVAFIAEDENSIIGAVRLSIENEIPVLRGMFVDKKHQRKGIGKLMLFHFEKALPNQDCYCLPYAHLLDFYGIIGFRQIDKSDLPPHLRQRLEKYLADGLDMT
ncbi:MAG: GNAT family N-acetyltransferase, partial [Pyrinomonadaceae bacterium]